MAMQYIGARYVPKYATPFEWDINATYEALTVVGYQGNSYTSKIPVPAGVQISNEKYWALTNSQSGAVNDLANRVTTAETEIDSLQSITDTLTDDVMENKTAIGQNTKDIAANTQEIAELKTDIESIRFTGTKIVGMKNVVLVGDSYATYTNNWVKYLVPLMGLTADNYVLAARSGAGYVMAGNVNFQSLVEQALAQKSQEWISNVTHLIVCTAGNDRNYTDDVVETAVKNFADYWKRNLPNATCYTMNIGRTLNHAYFLQKWNAYAQIERAARANGMTVCSGTEAALYKRIWMAEDGNHPNDLGCVELANVIYNAVLQTHVPITTVKKAFTNEMLPNFKNGATLFYEYMYNSQYCLGCQGDWPNGFKYELLEPITTTANSFAISDFNSEYATGSYTTRNLSVPCTAIDSAGNEHEACMYPSTNQMWVLTKTKITGLQAVVFMPFQLMAPIVLV